MKLFHELAGNQPVTAGALAGRLHLDREAVRRWARAALVLGVLELRGDKVRLRDGWHRVLLDPAAEDYRAGDVFYAVGRTLFAKRLLAGFGASNGIPTMHEIVSEATRWEHNRIVQQVVPMLVGASGTTGFRVLDVGCGTGGWILRFLKSYPSAFVAGVDPNSQAVAQARKRLAAYLRAGKVELYHGEVHRVKVKGDFGLIDCCEVLSIADDPLSILETSGAILAGGGSMVVTEGLLHDSLPSMPNLSDKLAYGVDFDLTGMNGRLFRPEELVALFRRAGFNRISRVRLGGRLWSYILRH